jgi:hypothetical protein
MVDIHNIESIDRIEQVRLVHACNKKILPAISGHHHPMIQNPDSQRLSSAVCRAGDTYMEFPASICVR